MKRHDCQRIAGPMRTTLTAAPPLQNIYYNGRDGATKIMLENSPS